MKQVNIREAKNKRSRLLRRVSLGEEIAITKQASPGPARGGNVAGNTRPEIGDESWKE